jgi:copper chaperone
MERKTMAVSGMSCTGCEQNVEDALATLDGVSRAEADHEGDAVEVVVEDDVADDAVATAIEEAGYEVASA